MSLRKIVFLSALAALIAMFMPIAVFAQVSNNPKKEKVEDDPDRLVDQFGTDVPIDTIDLSKRQDDYVDPNYQNLSKLMWVLGTLSLSDNEAIDNYLKINECTLFMRFYHNDLEWEKIREATRTYINDHMAEFPTKFEILVPIYLDRYDSDKGVFNLTQDSRIVNARRLDLGLNGKHDNCAGQAVNLKGYSRNIILTLNRPFSLASIPVGRELAELYIEEARANYENMPLKLRMQYYERVAFLRAKIRISSFKEMIYGRQGDFQAVVFGHLDGIEVYADTDKQKLLYREDKKERSIRQRRIEEHKDKEYQDAGVPPPADKFGAQ